MLVRNKIIDLLKKITKAKTLCINDEIPILEQVNIDSINVLSLIVEIEELFHISIEANEVRLLSINYLKEKVSKDA